MKKIARELIIHTGNGTFNDIIDIHKWVLKTRPERDQSFSIHLEILEMKEVPEEQRKNKG